MSQAITSHRCQLNNNILAHVASENAIEQQKDEMISDQIRSQYKGMTGSDFPIKDKE